MAGTNSPFPSPQDQLYLTAACHQHIGGKHSLCRTCMRPLQATPCMLGLCSSAHADQSGVPPSWLSLLTLLVDVKPLHGMASFAILSVDPE